ncbi:MAG: hypothetical protein SP4CHLAM5_07720 [Chlamydiia bacterium]|nr:hypothetical protein [Chlamydiia bacterium]MCH9618637.1 hypothetical protein [Chlamydiia bacterium]MCH9623828.1 hypothetical protein [Chlamydiia bacterium]
MFRILALCILGVGAFTSSLYGKNAFYVSAYDQEIMPDHVYRPRKPLMWNARLKVDRSIMMGFEQPIYAYKKHIELYSGISCGYMQTLRNYQDTIGVVSAYLLARLYIFRSDIFNGYFIYSPAGPSLLTKAKFASTSFSNNFVFQNQFGIGASIGKNAETEFFLKLYHYSNGDIFPINGGIDIPLVIGMSFVL